MRIVIRQSLKPYSLQPGFRCLIPLTSWEAQVFPSKAILCDLKSKKQVEISLPFGGKLEGFRTVLNLERGRIEVESSGEKPFFLTAESHSSIKKIKVLPSKNRLSLGIHKKQDVDLMTRRMSMAEIFPIWIKLSEWIPEFPLPSKPIGTMHLLNPGSLCELYQAGFERFFCPRFLDSKYLGFVKEEVIPKKICPIGLIHKGAFLIKSLFFFQEKDVLHFLPNLPKEFHAGRFVCLETKEGDQFDIEWSKKTLKKLIFRPCLEREVVFNLQNKLKTFRIRTNLRARGEMVNNRKPLSVKPGQVLYCDRFSRS